MCVGFSQSECDSQHSIMQAKLVELEEQAYQLAGHPFSLSATDDIAQVSYTTSRAVQVFKPKYSSSYNWY